MQQQVILGTLFHEQSDSEMVNSLGKSVSNVYTLRHRGLRNLQVLLASEK
jgi:DNA-directed RNA polymerase specialized sigma24 family protein